MLSGGGSAPKILFAFGVGTFVIALAMVASARQPGQPCGTCHTDFAGLTPYGRLFKIGGYTAGGGKYRSTLFPSSDDSDNTKKPYVPPIAMMAIVGFTNTRRLWRRRLHRIAPITMWWFPR